MNINEIVTIKLNENGMGILRAEHAELKSAFPSLHNFVEIEPDEDGFYQKKMQLWSVMQTFGPHIRLCVAPPFDTEIYIPCSDDVNKLKAMNKELLAVIERVIGSSNEFAKIMGTSEWADGYKQCSIDTGETLRGMIDNIKAKGTA